MIYIKNFTFPSADKEERYLCDFYKKNHWQESYPFKVLARCNLRLDLEEITILCGGNGSGKSTALNVIGHKLGVRRKSAYNKGDLQKEYLELCGFDAGGWNYELSDLKKHIRFISSDDIFKYMQDIRTHNDHFDIRRNTLSHEISRIKNRQYTPHEQDALRHLDFETGENVDTFMRLTTMKKRSVPQNIQNELGSKAPSYSNGETGFMRFAEEIVPDCLYLLDEPENSLSCELQMKLAEFIEQSARYCRCQFIIATHSPFILSLQGAKIYNLDTAPAKVSHWWELPNMQIMYSLFKEYDKEFINALQ